MTLNTLKFKSMITRATFLRAGADFVLINSAFLIAKMVLKLRIYDSSQSFFHVTKQSILQAFILSLIGVIVFAACGFYSHGRAYASRYKVALIFQAVSLLYILYGFLMFFVGVKFMPPTQNAFLLAWFFTLLFVGGSRLYSTFWRDVILREEKITPSRERDRTPRRILVIGGAGYIGSVLCRKALARGFEVRVLDALLYGDDAIRDLVSRGEIEFVRGDSRDIVAVVQAMKDADIVVHLGEIVGDPATGLDEAMTREINIAATRMVAQAAKGYGALRFIYASSCSVYGASEVELDECSAVKPLSLYAQAKIEAENTLLKLNDANFHPTILRLATVFGMSPRPRFDLAVNFLAAKAVTDKSVTLNGGGQWRPFIHVSDVAEAILRCIKVPLVNVKGEIFNVGSNRLNYTIAQLADIVRVEVPGTEIVLSPTDADRRNYRVRFEKIRRKLGFKPQLTLEDGVREIIQAVKCGAIANYLDKRYSNYKTLSEDNTRQPLSQRRINEIVSHPTNINTVMAAK